MKIQAFVVADDPAYLHWLQGVAGAGVELRRIEARAPDEVLAAIASEQKVDLVFCEFDMQNLAQRAMLIERLLERYAQLPIVGLGDSDNPDLVLAAMRAGARDFFVLRRDDATLGVQISRLLRRSGAGSAPSVSADRPGHVYALLAADPDESLAFLAEHLSLALHEHGQENERVLLIDLSTPAGAAAVFLNLNQAYTVLDAINDAHRCDQTLVDTTFGRHSSGLYVLSLPEDLVGAPLIDSQEMLRLLRVLSGLFLHVVVAVDGYAPMALLTGIAEQAERLLLLSDQSILGSRHNKHLLRALRQRGCTLERAGLVVDNYRRRLGLEPRNLAELFELPLVATLPAESHNRLVSMNTGEPLVTLARKDPFWIGVQQLAEHLLSGRTIVATAPGLLKRFFN